MFAGGSLTGSDATGASVGGISGHART
jgi:hypothetical protein